MKRKWDEYDCEYFEDECFPQQFLDAVQKGQVLILIKKSKCQEDDEGLLSYDIAVYDSAFPFLTEKRYSYDRSYFYFSYPNIISVIGRRFEGNSEDVVDFLSTLGVSYPDIMNMDTIQRASGLVNMFGCVCVLNTTVLPVSMVSEEHVALESLGAYCDANSSSCEKSDFVSKLSLVASKLGCTYEELKEHFDCCKLLMEERTAIMLPVTHERKFDLLGGRLKFHEALNCDFDEINQTYKGVMEGFVREALEELDLSNNILEQKVEQGIYYISVMKESINLQLKIFKPPSLCFCIVEIKNT